MDLEDPELSASSISLISNKSATVSFFFYCRETFPSRNGAILIFKT